MCIHSLQLYLRRLKLCKNEKERKYFEQINDLYMTEESDESDGTCFRQHKPTWRSQSMRKVMSASNNYVYGYRVENNS